MKKLRGFFKSRPADIALIIAGTLLLAVSAVGGVRAAVSVFSGNYRAEVELYDIGVTLMEKCNGGAWNEDLSHRNYNKRENAKRTGDWDETEGTLLTGFADTDIVLGQSYPEEIAVRNSGTIDEYVRLTIVKYWVDENGKKMNSTVFSPDLIEVEFVNPDLWVEDTAARAREKDVERRVFYYQPLLSSGESTEPLTKSIRIKDAAGGAVVYGEGGTVAARYKGKTFVLEAEADAVQDHNADSAKSSAWGQVR